MPSFEGNLLTQRHEICSYEIRDSSVSYGEQPGVSPGLESVPGRDRQTDSWYALSTTLCLKKQDT